MYILCERSNKNIETKEMPGKGRRTQRKHRTQWNITHKGGKHLYINVNQITIPIIESVFCNGQTIRDLPRHTNPLYVLKWGPPGSGKSSYTINELIKTFGHPLNTYFDYDSDKLIELLIPYRMKTAVTKAKALRMQANYEIHDYAHIKELLQRYTSNINPYHMYFDASLVQQCKNFYEEWGSGQSLNSEHKDKLNSLIRDITDDETSAIYKYYRRNARNNSGASIQDKLKQVLRSAFARNVNILDESTGSGYGEDSTSTYTLKDPLAGTRFSKRQQEMRERGLGMIDIYINSKEALLGRIQYNEYKEPIGIDKSSITIDSIPMNYRIYVLYPVIPKTEILKRVHKRAIYKFTQRNIFTLPENDAVIDEYKEWLSLYFKELIQILGGNKPKLRNVIDEIIEAEQTDYRDSYTDYIQRLLISIRSMDADSTLSTPMFSGIAQNRIEEAIEAAFHYSIDYFLKQYLIIGRIERVLYVSTLGKKDISTEENTTAKWPYF